MVHSDKKTEKEKDKKLDYKIEKSKMVDEGGLGVEADYNYDEAKESKKSESEIEASEMVEEGGLGAVLYYDKDEIVVDPEAAYDKAEADDKSD